MLLLLIWTQPLTKYVLFGEMDCSRVYELSNLTNDLYLLYIVR